MIENGKTVKLKVNQFEGQTLLNIAANFTLSPEWGALKWNVTERVLAARAVSLLYEELKSWSPSLPKQLLFGPIDNWEKKSDGDKEAWGVVDLKKTMEVRVSPKIMQGLYWVLLAATHPDSPFVHSAGNQAEVIWPIAARVRLVGKLEKELGLKLEEPVMEFDPVPAEEAK